MSAITCGLFSVFRCHLIYLLLLDCNDVGLSTPCLLRGYWRVPLDDMSVYYVYKCDVSENCLGGCAFNQSCKEAIDQSSPTCGE